MPQIPRTVSVGAIVAAGVLAVALTGVLSLLTRVLSGVGSVGAAAQYVAAVAALFAGVAVGHAASRANGPWLEVLASIVAGATLVGVVALDGLGYANADAALVVQAAGLVGVVLVRRRAPRPLVAVALLPFLAIQLPLLSQARAGAVTCLAVLVAATAAPMSERALRRFTVGAGVTLASLALLQVAATQAGLRPPLLATALSEARFNLWADALELIGDRPLLGHGPGAFSLLSPAARRWALPQAHSSALEVTAELGLVGLALLVALVAAGFRLPGPASSPGSAVAVAAWVGLWVHSLVDYVADYPAVMLVAGLVVGATLATRSLHSEPDPVHHSGASSARTPEDQHEG